LLISCRTKPLGGGLQQKVCIPAPAAEIAAASPVAMSGERRTRSGFGECAGHRPVRPTAGGPCHRHSPGFRRPPRRACFRVCRLRGWGCGAWV